jgi:hypothetical protein
MISRGDEPEDGFVILRASDDTRIAISLGEAGAEESIGEDIVLDVSPGSDFVQIYRHFLIGPIAASSNQSRMRMELVPENVDNRCAGPMMYVEGTRTSQQDSRTFRAWSLNIIAQIIPDTESEFPLGPTQAPGSNIMSSHFLIHLESESLPWDTVIYPLIQHVESRSNARRVEDSGTDISELRFENCDTLSVFPGILYSFYRPSDTVGSYTKEGEVILYPEDYVDIVTGSDSRSYCNVNIRTSSSSGIGTIGSNILRSVVAHFDSLREKIGFCDPAV